MFFHVITNTLRTRELILSLLETLSGSYSETKYLSTCFSPTFAFPNENGGGR